MCGIIGIIRRDGKRVGQDEIKEMTDRIAHRGPDDEGCYIKDSLGLGHRRLSILDLSPAGHQPFHYRQVVIIFNGEIYNYIELRSVLMKEGFNFSTGTDTEVIAAAYLLWGEECVKYFNGMWAFCLFDTNRNILFCSRDRFGVKPFYYLLSAEEFSFASEIKALAPRMTGLKPNYNVLMDYIVMGLEEHTHQTFFEGVVKLQGSHNLVYNLSTHKLVISRYYELSVDQGLKKLPLDEACSVFGDMLVDAVRLRLRSDVKVGSCLSGGLDSSAIVAVAAGLYNHQERFNTINARSIDPANDESCYAKMVADHTGSNCLMVTPQVENFRKHIRELVYAQEEPFGSLSIFMQYSVFQKAKEAGCIVMLDGQGGDEILLGYPKYNSSVIFSMPLMKRYKVFRQLSKNSSFSIKDILLYHLYFGYPYIRIARLKRNFSYIKPEYLEMCSFDRITQFSRALHNVEEMQRQELFSLQLPHLLKYEDKNSMAHSIESRLPLLDYRVVETALSLDNQFKIYEGWTKYPIRKAFEHKLPAAIVWRKDKIGFAAPEDLLLKEKEPLMMEIRASPILNRIMDRVPETIPSRQLWRLYNTALWEKAFNLHI